MPQVIETVVYRIDELTDRARDTARARYREHCMDHPWYDFVYEDFQTICELLGIDLRTSPVTRVGGASREDPHIFFRGFWSQGDGASYEGRYRYNPGSAKAIRAHAPQDAQLHRIADTLQAVQRNNFFQLQATIRQHGSYVHQYTMQVSVERDSPTWQDMTEDAESTVTEALRDLAHWLYRQLGREYEYQSSDELVDETLAINEWTFTAAGQHFG